jgi:putative ABC transport system permease protein
VLPVVGRVGMMVDLDATRRVAADAELGGTFEVWLAPGAPEPVVDALRKAGLTVTGDISTAGRSDELAQQGSVITAGFGLLTTVMALLLAAAMLAVTAAVERGPYTEQLRTLRIQGLPRAAADVAGYAGTVALAVAGLAGGVVAAVVAVEVAAVVAPPFADGWQVIPPPGALGLGALSQAALVAGVTLGVAAWLSVLPLVRRLRAGAR